jgi:SnoaL-like domain
MLDDTYTVEFLAARAEIRDVVYRWCRAIDRLDYSSIKTLFHPDAIDSHGMYDGGIDGLVDWIEERHRTIPISTHSVSNMLIEFLEPNVAVVETYCFAVQRYGDDAGGSLAQLAKGAEKTSGAVDVMACVRYVDRFSKRQAGWLIEHRSVVYDSVMTFRVPEDAPKLASNWIIGRRNQTDCVYEARAK